MYSSLVGLGFSGLSSFAADLSKGLASAERVFDILDKQPVVAIEEGARPTTATNGELVLNNVWFRYPTREKDVLRGINLRVQAGSTVALTGTSGGGKSTIAALLTRLYDPQQGLITLDGVDLSTVAPSWLRTVIGVVEQDPVLFAGTIADNIRFGRPEATTEHVEAAASEANAHDFITEFPQGKQYAVASYTVSYSTCACRR
jgi:ABC-type multidrug transport system fused ATPase/permease subunit